MSPPGRPKGEYRSAQHGACLMSRPGRPKGESLNAKHEATPVSAVPTYILGGHQTDFSKVWSRNGQDISDMIREAALVAMADARIEPAIGAEKLKNLPGDESSANQNAAAWQGREDIDCRFMWPAAFGLMAQEYERRYGLQRSHLNRIAEINYANAKRNPLAQTRKWAFDALAFTDDDEANPLIEPGTRRQDCGQITDGAAALVLASPATPWAPPARACCGTPRGRSAAVQGRRRSKAPGACRRSTSAALRHRVQLCGGGRRASGRLVRLNWPQRPST